MAPEFFFLLCSGLRDHDSAHGMRISARMSPACQQSLLSFMQCVHDISLFRCIGTSESVVQLHSLWKLRKECRLGACYGSRRVAGTCVEKHFAHVDRLSPASFRSICGELIQVDDSLVSLVKRFRAESFEARRQFMYMNFRFMTRFEHIFKVLQALRQLIYFKLGIDTSGEH